MNNLPGGGSWSVRDSASTTISCRTASTWDAWSYAGQIPIDYDSGGGSVAVWAGNNSCTGAPTSVYPSTGLSTSISGGDVYSYSASGGSTATAIASSSITINSSGVISN